MLNDLQHLIVGTDKARTDIAGISCRPLTLQTFALLELTGNEILTSPSTRMLDVLGFLWLHSAPENEIADAVAAHMAGDKKQIITATLKLPTIPLSDISTVATQIREMIEKAMGSQVQVEGETTSAGN